MLQTSNQQNDEPIFSDEATKKKIDRHLSDINDKITDEDIRNVKTDVTPNKAGSPTETLSGNDAEGNGKEDGNNSNSIQTPWNILDED
jgi:hypothetical protein